MIGARSHPPKIDHGVRIGACRQPGDQHLNLFSDFRRIGNAEIQIQMTKPKRGIGNRFSNAHFEISRPFRERRRPRFFRSNGAPDQRLAEANRVRRI